MVYTLVGFEARQLKSLPYFLFCIAYRISDTIYDCHWFPVNPHHASLVMFPSHFIDGMHKTAAFHHKITIKELFYNCILKVMHAWECSLHEF